MEAILVSLKNDKEKKMLKDFLKSNGISSAVVSEKMKRYLAGLEMTEIAEQHPKLDISDEEIIKMLKEDEEEIYGKYRKKSSD